MNISFFSKSKYTFLVMGIISVTVLFILYRLNSTPKSLPILNPIDINPRLVDNSLLNKSKKHRIGHFNLTDQNGKMVTAKNFENKVYVADFFFTRCGTICPIMSHHMSLIQEAFKYENNVKLISHSVTPQMDSIPVLKAYAEAHGAIDDKWYLTTGSKKEIYHLARKNYFAVLDEGDGGLQDFIHTEQFVLVDTEKRIRGFYDGTSKDEISQLIKDIQSLLETPSS